MITLEQVRQGVTLDGPRGSIELTLAGSGWWFIRCYTRHIKKIYDCYEDAWQWLVDGGYDVSRLPEPDDYED